MLYYVVNQVTFPMLNNGPASTKVDQEHGNCCCCLNPVNISGDSGVYTSEIRIGTTVTETGDAHLNPSNEKRTATVTLINNFNMKMLMCHVRYRQKNKTNLACVLSGVSSANFIIVNNAILLIADCIFQDFDGSFQQ